MSYYYSGNDLLGGSTAIPPLMAAWGVKILNPSYTGPLIRVRESGGNTQTDISASGTELDTTALLAHTGSNNGFVTTVYDQVGSNHITQGTDGAQPRIVNAGAVDQPGGKTAWLYVSSDYLTLGAASPTFDSDLTAMVWVIDFYANATTGFPGLIGKGNADSSTSGCYLVFLSSGTANFIVYTGAARSTTLTTAASTVANSTWIQMATTWLAGQTNHAKIFLDGVEKANQASASGASIAASGHHLIFGGQQGNSALPTINYPFNGYIRSIRLYRQYIAPRGIATIFSKGI